MRKRRELCATEQASVQHWARLSSLCRQSGRLVSPLSPSHAVFMVTKSKSMGANTRGLTSVYIFLSKQPQEAQCALICLHRWQSKKSLWTPWSQSVRDILNPHRPNRYNSFFGISDATVAGGWKLQWVAVISWIYWSHVESKLTIWQRFIWLITWFWTGHHRIIHLPNYHNHTILNQD